MSSVKLVERVDQLAELEFMASRARGGVSGVVLIEGAVGSGKTALLATWAARERGRGMKIVEGWCSAAESDLPFGAVRQLFDGTPGAVHVPAPRSQPSGSALFEIFDALHQAVRALCTEQAVLLTVDDLHWCDAQSAQWLGYLVRRLSGLPVLLAATSPMTTPATPTLGRRVVPEIVDHPRCRRVGLPALTAEGVGQFLQQGLGHTPQPAVTQACWSATGGNPQLLQEVLTALRGPRPGVRSRSADDITDLVRRLRVRTIHARVQREATEVATLARIAAVLAEGADLQLTAVVAGLDERTAVLAVQVLRDMGVLRRGGPGVVFADPRLREALGSDITAEERTVLLARAARISHDAGAGNEQVAQYLLQTAEPIAQEWVTHALHAAAHDALRRRAPEDAAAYLRRALRQPLSGPIREQLLMELGSALLYRNPAAACRHLSEVMATADGLGRRAQAAIRLSTAHRLSGRPDAAISVLVNAAAALGSSDEDIAVQARHEIELHLNVQRTLARVIGPWGREPTTAERPTADRAAAARTRSDAAWRLGVQALETMLTGGSAAQTREAATEAFRSGLQTHEGSAELSLFVAFSLICTDGLDEAERALGEIWTGSKRSGARILQAAAGLGRSMVHRRRGELREALGLGESVVDELFALPPSCFRGSAVAHMVTLLLDDGRLEEAHALGCRMNGSHGDGWESAMLSLVRGRLRAATDDVDGALAQFLDCGRRLHSYGSENPGLLSWRPDAVILHTRLGERERARRLAEEEMRLAERWGTPRVIGRALWTEGIARGGDEGRRLLAAAVTHQEQAGARLELTRTLIDYGVAESRAGQLRHARMNLRRAVDLARLCGASKLVEQASTELSKTGARPRRSGSDRLSSLTPGELRVARLAAAGARNREIAAELHVTARAVERHLTSVYRKLGVNGRSALAEVLKPR
ncbi:AAA family ATPase [Streptomyces sp. NA02950]|uniref:ATP-binding protein n=1 Tax=Streptomyces sp. NA02950 TaxID=2742137 RepID=UPI0015913D04|nr:LuxR family transcriptional regulator [Streptomyces sp. NA02950]QKV94597.1 AAA family ATPase [Streptomyces sp. NA02950]